MIDRAVSPRQNVVQFVSTSSSFVRHPLGEAVKSREHTASVSSMRRIQRPPVLRAKA
jgi:hypothetical protein